MIKTPLSTVVGGAFWTPNATVIGGTSNTFNQLIKSLFANNEQGFAYDPNDLTTMFQDAAGDVPVTGVGQPVGLMLDKSKGLVLGVNLVPQKSFAEGTTGWLLQTGWTLTEGKVACSGSTSLLLLNTQLGLGKRYRITIAATRTSTSGTLSIRNGSTTSSSIATIQATGTEVIERNVYVSDNTYPHIYFLSHGWVGEITSISIEEIVGNHTYQTTSASRPILRQNATTGAYYLEFDGSDDFLQTSNIDFTATDKVSLFTGVRKLRDSPAESILELGVLPYDGVGTFWLNVNALTPNDVWIAIAQSWDARTGFSKITPVANNFVFSAKLDFAGSVATDEIKPRLNGSTTGFTRGLLEHAGTGNFGNHPLYIGRRGGTLSPFNGHIYSLVGVGRLTTDDETITLERDLARRTGVTLSV